MPDGMPFGHGDQHFFHHHEHHHFFHHGFHNEFEEFPFFPFVFGVPFGFRDNSNNLVNPPCNNMNYPYNPNGNQNM